MSHNASPTITNNTNIYYNSLNSNLKEMGLQPIKSTESVPHATKEALSQMTTAMELRFKTTFPNVTLPPDTGDGGYCGPLSAIQPGVAPSCVVSQISLNFKNWGISTSLDTVNELAQTITQEVVSKAGGTGFSHGTMQLTTNENIYWMVGYLTANITQDEQGVIYTFTAVEALDIS